jgi:RimJ/RimL family protein N-acetyltransferase
MEHFFAPERHEAGGFVLRSYDVGDGPQISAALSESYEHLRPWMPWAVPQQSIEASEASARRFRARYLLSEDFVIGVFAADTHELLGGTGFHLREGPVSSGCAEIGMYVRKSVAGQGLGTRVLESMLDWGFSSWPWQRLAWRCDQRNVASVRVAQKAGLQLEGVLRGQAAEVGEGRRDTACFALTKADFRAAKAV